MAEVSPLRPSSLDGFSLRAAKQTPAREVPIELRVSRHYDCYSLSTTLSVDGHYNDGGRVTYAQREVKIDLEQWGEDGVVDLVALMAKAVAHTLGAELK